MKILKILATGVILGAASMSAASAATVGFELDGHKKVRNFAFFSLTNTSSDAQIESMSLTIGKKKFNFDIVRAEAGTRIVKGDTRNNKARHDEIEMAFNNFQAGETTRFRLDIDRDRKKKRNKADYSKVLFNNGRAQNALITVTFSNGEVLSTFLDDNGAAGGLTSRLLGGSQYNTLASMTRALEVTEIANLKVGAVPVPAALPLMLGGLFGLGMVARRRNS